MFEQQMQGAQMSPDMVMQNLVDEFTQDGVSPAMIDQMIEAVTFVLQNPDQYEMVRADAIMQGWIDEDDLPPVFDEQVLTLALQVLQHLRQSLPEPQMFAKGGLAALAKKGRGSDTMLAHINPREARILQKMSGSGAVNPNTGLREFKGLKKLFKKVLKLAPLALAFVPGMQGLGASLGSSILGASAPAWASSALGSGLIGGVTGAMSGSGFGKGFLGGAIGGGLSSALGGSGGGLSVPEGGNALGLNFSGAGVSPVESAASGLSTASSASGLSNALSGAGAATNPLSLNLPSLSDGVAAELGGSFNPYESSFSTPSLSIGDVAKQGYDLYKSPVGQIAKGGLNLMNQLNKQDEMQQQMEDMEANRKAQMDSYIAQRMGQQPAVRTQSQPSPYGYVAGFGRPVGYGSMTNWGI